MKAFVLATVLVLCLALLARSEDAFLMKIIVHPDRNCVVVQNTTTEQWVAHLQQENEKVHVHKSPFAEFEDMPPSKEEIAEIVGLSYKAVWNQVQSLCNRVEVEKAPATEADEVFKIVYTGSPSNRVDIVFMGDGYQADEKEKHAEDMKRLVQDMFVGQTFMSYLPLFNVWGVFRPSVERGIGVARPKNTAYGLYREGNTLRAIFTSKSGAAYDACSKTGKDACDYPVLIGNDPYYGGLGGAFSISTSSNKSGTIVLRHELGHSIGVVGEEYDGGYVYSGANWVSDLNSAKSKWGKWLNQPVAVQETVQRFQNYPWTDLAPRPYVVKFSSDGKWNRWFIRMSISGAETQDAVNVTLDGQLLPWRTQHTLDRSFSEFIGSALSAGEHTLVVSQVTRPATGRPRMICNLQLNEYKDESKFKFDNNYISAYPVFINTRPHGYRPNNELCLMRNMTSVHFCAICKENLWHRLLDTVNIVDNIDIKTDASTASVAATFLKLGQYRETPVQGEKLEISWFKNGTHQPNLDGKDNWKDSKSAAAGNWKLQVKFITLEVRDREMIFSKTFHI